ncbi:MAG: hypothetical protein GWN99_07265 [Gemmatimonadetes bacterium]|uniref:Uncharacterized protein n=1 Tax=Candidatus Kutchimonas denitrificans TaxID=3056748 RepID=A0AAE5CAC7_9BACT|nr:hypothetical protein [Gemmatimonadota bacterium]NIR74462.1 hypothetical protein [Candidatus Kutchimonas denitrificans]NIS00858.1 hypothetical protein [Gemmatimonadota bacterium]NIT66481.1 hypothetical protein [Gemmatimonadota bacterium]NIU52112.1 hypothetical protein [Gemmatimonadota bacterium]
MIGRLVLRHLALHPIRSLVFVGAYAAGVSVMLSLLSIGEVMLEQSRDEELVGGGDITVVPAGVDLETLRTGGAVYFGIQESRFIARGILGGPRLEEEVETVGPWIEDRAVYVRVREGEAPVAVRASGQVPSAARALGAAPTLVEGRWADSDADRRWLVPTAYELYSEIDAFHLPPARVRGDTTWAEWHYFNLLWPEEERWLYLAYLVTGDPSGDRWGGMVLASYRLPDGRNVSFGDTLSADEIQFSTSSPDLTFGPHTVRLLDGPARYQVQARLPSLDGGPPLGLALELRPGADRYFPPAELAASDSFVSGYVVPALRASAAGRVCRGDRCVPVDETIAYHDHNWGTWGGVAWDWGVARAGPFDLLYGGVHGAAADEARRYGARFLAYVVDSLGVAAALEPDALRYSGQRVIEYDGAAVEVPERLEWTAVQAPDSIHARIELEHVSLSRLSLGGDADVYFAQMQGTLELGGVIGGRRVAARGRGFFETYLR